MTRKAAVATAVAVAVVVGLDRMFLGVHFPSDVLAGLLLGVGITFSSWIGFIGKTAVTSSPRTIGPGVVVWGDRQDRAPHHPGLSAIDRREDSVAAAFNRNRTDLWDGITDVWSRSGTPRS